MSASPCPFDQPDQSRGPRGLRLVRSLARRFAQHEVRRDGEFAASCSAGQLRSACRLVASDPSGDSIPRVDVTVPCPRSAGGALVVLEYARDLAQQHRLEARCVLHRDLVTVTFVRRGTEHGREGTA